MGFVVTEKSLVVQHNRLIEARYKLSLTEQRLIKLLVSMIEREDEDFKQYVVCVADLADLLGIKSGDIYPAIEKAIDRLMDTPINFKDGDDKVKVRWLSSSRYQPKKGIALLRFDPELKPFLLQIKERYTSYQLVNIIRLKHIHSIRIYELLKQYQGLKKRRFSVVELKHILMIGDSEYKQYRDFRRWVIKVSQAELKEKTDITFEFTEEIRKNGRMRTVEFIEFIISENKRPVEKVEIKNPLIKEIGTEKIEKNNTELVFNDAHANEAENMLISLGVGRSAARKLANEYGVEKVKSAVAYTQIQYKEGKVKNPAGFVIEAVKNHYQDSKAEERKRQEAALQETKNKEAKARWWKAYKESYQKAKDTAFEKWFPGLNQQEVAERREKYMASLTGIVRERETMANIMFMNEMKGVMEFPSLREYGKMNGIDLTAFEEELRQEELEQEKRVK